jgi:hypothetical protein
LSEPHEHRNGWGRVAVVALISFLATSGFWNVLNQYANNDKVTRAEVRTIVEESGPYTKDRAMILKGLEELNKKVDELRAEIRAERKR